jgi:hypothetical protein
MRILSRFSPLFPGQNYSAAQNIPVSAKFSGQNTPTTKNIPVLAPFPGQYTPTTKKYPSFRPISRTKCHPHKTGYGCNKKGCSKRNTLSLVLIVSYNYL